jgi:lipopolysaccharide/colanic/teichoic acid biosynthesis glycosyltransferase
VLSEGRDRRSPIADAPALRVVTDGRARRGPGNVRIAKRGTDIVFGTILAIVALPVILLLAVGSTIALRTWPFFIQHRVGKGGRPFAFPKLRTLPRSAPPIANKYQLAEIELPAYCRLLRRTHLDELPQLLLVPLGRMSLVGPRPEMPRVLAHYDADFAAERALVRPGCTGLWQISSCAGMMIYESPEYDQVYLRSGSLRLDAWILYRTARTWLPRCQWITLEDVPPWAIGPGFLDTASEPERPVVTIAESSTS